MAMVIGQHHDGFKPVVRSPRCRLQSYTQLDYQTMLDNFNQTNFNDSLRQALEFSALHKSLSTPCLSHSPWLTDEDLLSSPSRPPPYSSTTTGSPMIEIIGGYEAPLVRAMVVEVAGALASGTMPEPVSSGLGGAYFLKSKNGATIGVAKPMDEEPLAINNPKGLVGGRLGQPGMKRSIRVGETGFRELAAYFLDHDGFAGVPPTALVRITHAGFNVNQFESISAPQSKMASLQRFVDHECDAGDLGPSSFSVSSVHRIGILDIRLLNLDRHAGNILVKQGRIGGELVPIDHGFCLPDSLDDPYFEWLHWPQASVPFSSQELEYISRLDPAKDAELLRREITFISESSIRILMVCTILLKQASASGLCLAQIGEMMTREFRGGEETCSVLESLCMRAKSSLRSRTADENTVAAADLFDQVIEEDNVSNTKQVSPTTRKPSKKPRYSLENSVGGGGLEDTAVLEPNSSQNGEKKAELDGPGDISFGQMSDRTWALFLEIFCELLPEVLEGRKCL